MFVLEVMEEMSPNLKGNIAEAVIAAEATKLGIEVLRPQTEHARYDLAFDLGDRIARIQCKWALKKGETVLVRLVSSARRAAGFSRRRYLENEIDFVAAYCDELDTSYLLPAALIHGRSAVTLRLSPARNGQLAAVNSAAEYEFRGAVAQLEERCHGMAEVTGSSPVSSIDGDPVAIGCHELGRRTGWYVQRAARGERFLISRRGRPVAELTPVADPTGLSAPSDPESAVILSDDSGPDSLTPATAFHRPASHRPASVRPQPAEEEGC